MALVDIRPTVRRRVSRISSYVVFVALVVVLAFMADWPRIRFYFFNAEVAASMWPRILRATWNTLLYTAVSFTIGTALATALALMKMSKGPFKAFAVAFIEIFRGMPALLTIFLLVYAVPIAFKGMKYPGGMIWGGVLGLIIVTGAYTAEIIRAGIMAVPKGQREASRSLGMSPMHTTVSVILPQAFRIVIPPLTNELVMLLKDTSLLFIAGATVLSKELTQFGREGVTTFGNGTPLIVVAVFYLIITIPLTYLVSRLEKKMAVKQ
ncbi:MAG: amino acid ABC transporter permease [Propionibacteriaceae bacterium]|jgi:polar amino acid transport system permease protein|nr:amino acid ABC transporter permease [Propionibacteriaceae bacterium]